MSEPIEGVYFNWLCAKVLSLEIQTYYDLLDVLYKTEFVWVVSGDRNRVEDGLELRTDFLRETGWEPEHGWLHEPCSVLEVLISFAKRAAFQTDMPTRDWFWIFINNLGLEDYRTISQSDMPVIEGILHNFVWRTYSPEGYGGMFPIRGTPNDQTKIEIWYQFCEYLDDQGLI